MDKFNTFIFWLMLILLGATLIFFWPTKNRMTEFCSDKLYGYPEQIKKYNLRTKITTDAKYQSHFKGCEQELSESPQTFKIKYRLEALRYRVNNWETIFQNWSKLKIIIE